MPEITHINVFSCFGGMALGLEQANPDIRTLALFETNKPCRYLLENYWDAPVIHKADEFIREVGKHERETGVGVVTARFRRAKDWKLIRQTIAAAKPRVVIIESMASLRSHGLVELLKDLWSFGFDAEGHVIPACDVGAPYKGERFWIIAHTHADGLDAPVHDAPPERTVGKQYVTDDLLDEYRAWVEGRRAATGGALFDQPRILRRHDRFSRRVDATRVRFLSDDVSPLTAGLMGFCLNRIANDQYREMPFTQMSLIESLSNVEKKTKMVVNVNALVNAGIPFIEKNSGLHLVITTKGGKIVDFWPSTNVYIVRGSVKRGSGIQGVISAYETL